MLLSRLMMSEIPSLGSHLLNWTFHSCASVSELSSATSKLGTRGLCTCLTCILQTADKSIVIVLYM